MIKEAYLLSRSYLDLQHLRVAIDLRIIKLAKDLGFKVNNFSEVEEIPLEKFGEAKEIVRTLITMREHLKSEEKNVLKDFIKLIPEDHKLLKWCRITKGLGDVAALTFLGYIDANKAITAGKVRAYFGLYPEAKITSGEKVKFNPEAKGRAFILARNVIMAKDPYYAKLYELKKKYYLENERKILKDGKEITFPPFKKIIENPKICPYYSSCEKRLVEKAKRLGRETKKPPCKLHCDMMAKIWLAGILVSHAAQLIREYEGLSIKNFLNHHGYIRPKEKEDDTPDKEVIDRILKGR